MFFKELGQKPWLTPSYIDNTDLLDQPNHYIERKTALTFFLLVVTVFFLLITVTFLSRSQYSDFQALAGEPWLPLFQPTQLWFNTLALLLASMTMQFAVMSTNKSKLNWGLLYLSFGVVFSCIFIFGQILVWQQLNYAGYGVNSNPANSFFYLFTGLHGMHLLGGLVVLFVVILRLYQRVNYRHFGHDLRLCTLYWHYLLLVWGILFLLLTASAQTYNKIALICGF